MARRSEDLEYVATAVMMLTDALKLQTAEITRLRGVVAEQDRRLAEITTGTTSVVAGNAQVLQAINNLPAAIVFDCGN